MSDPGTVGGRRDPDGAEPTPASDTVSLAPASPNADDAGDDARGGRRRRKRSLLRELPVLVFIAFAAALLIKAFVLQAFFIPSPSMEPTLRAGDRVLVEKVSLHFGGPERGDVVVFERDASALGEAPPPDDDSVFAAIGEAFRGLFGFRTGESQDFIKRVIAVGGDTIEGRGGEVLVNGEPVDEPYLPEGAVTGSFRRWEVPQGQIFVMGDNRSNSDDSRRFGPVPVDSVVGRAVLLVWPPGEFGSL